MRDTLSTVLVAILSLLSTEARAQDVETIADVRCVIVGVLLVQKADPAQRTAGSMLSMYYIGRLDGRVPKLDLEELILKEGGTMTNADFGAEAKRCGETLAARGQEITRIGQDIVARERKKSGEQAK
jgi:hypothetical protein